jgi:hypothetical protein
MPTKFTLHPSNHLALQNLAALSIFPTPNLGMQKKSSLHPSDHIALQDLAALSNIPTPHFRRRESYPDQWITPDVKPVLKLRNNLPNSFAQFVFLGERAKR